MAKVRGEWGTDQWNKSTIHSFINHLESLSAHLASEFGASPSLAELKVMKRTCDGTLETSLLALCLQKLSQLIIFPKELQTYTGSAASFQVPIASCSVQLRSEVERPDSAYAFPSGRRYPFFSNPHCTYYSWGLSHSWIVMWMLYNATHNDSILEARIY